MGEFVGGRIVPKHCGAWNKNSKYEMLSIVYQPETGDSYISRKSVPAGTALNSEEYWAICSEYSAQVRKLEQDVDADVEQMHTDLAQTKADMSKEFSETHVAMSKELTDTHTAISQELTETESRMQESLQQTTETLSGKVEQAQTDLNTGRKELNDAKTTLNKRMDSIAGGMTADSEILDARVDNQGTTHASLGEAMRSAEKTRGLWDDWLTTIVSQLLDEATGNTNYRLSEPITVEPYTPYCISAAGKAGYGLYAFYDVNGNRVGGENNTGNTDRKIENKVVTSPARAVSIRVACINGMQSCGIQPMTRGYFIGMKPKWYGRTWVCLGDSLTESNSRTTKHYFDYIAEKTGIKTVNLGVSGTGYMRRKDINRAFYQRVSDIQEDADVITIFGSGNDLSSDQTLGTVTDTGTDTICGCINATIDAIYERIPLARLGIVTPTPWVGSMPSKTTCGMAKYSEAIVEICKRRSIPCLDLYHESNLRPDDENFRKLAFSKDGGNGVHPDEKGHEIIAASFQSLLERLIL